MIIIFPTKCFLKKKFRKIITSIQIQLITTMADLHVWTNGSLELTKNKTNPGNSTQITEKNTAKQRKNQVGTTAIANIVHYMPMKTKSDDSLGKTKSINNVSLP